MSRRGSMHWLWNMRCRHILTMCFSAFAASSNAALIIAGQCQKSHMDELDHAIINHLQGDLPVCERPYLEAAQRVGITEDALLARLSRLLENGILTRIGPMFQIERMGGAFTLAALHAPDSKFDVVAAKVNALPEVAHNYARTHNLNMWFVIATETPAEIDRVISRIEDDTGCDVLNFPKSREYFVELKLKI